MVSIEKCALRGSHRRREATGSTSHASPRLVERDADDIDIPRCSGSRHILSNKKLLINLSLLPRGFIARAWCRSETDTGSDGELSECAGFQPHRVDRVVTRASGGAQTGDPRPGRPPPRLPRGHRSFQTGGPCDPLAPRHCRLPASECSASGRRSARSGPACITGHTIRSRSMR